MGALEFALKLHVPNTNVLLRFYVSNCLHSHPLRFWKKQSLSQRIALKGFSGACLKEIPIRKWESWDWTERKSDPPSAIITQPCPLSRELWSWDDPIVVPVEAKGPGLCVITQPFPLLPSLKEDSPLRPRAIPREGSHCEQPTSECESIALKRGSGWCFIISTIQINKKRSYWKLWRPKGPHQPHSQAGSQCEPGWK